MVLIRDWLEQIDGGSLVLVATTRLLQIVQREFAVLQQDHGQLVWESPKVYTWYDFLAEQYRLWSRSQEGASLLLNGAQERLLWQEALALVLRDQAVPNIGLMDKVKLSKTAQRSYMMMQEWHINHEQLQNLNDQDGQLFTVWITEFNRLCKAKGWIDTASLNVWASDQLNAIANPTLCLWLGFDLFTPAQQYWRAMLDDIGIRSIETSIPDVVREEKITRYPDSLSELTSVFHECRAELERDQSLRLAVVVPRLKQLLPQAKRAARKVFYPGASPLDLQAYQPLYEFSLGESLGDQPLIFAALNLIAAVSKSLHFDQVIQIFDCPWSIVGTNSINKKLIKALRRYSSDTFTLSYLKRQLESINEAGKAPEAFNRLVKIQVDLPRRQSPDLWAKIFFSILDSAGWAQTCKLDSTEFQQKKAWEGLLREFVSLGSIKSQLEFSEALQLLRELSNTPFQIQSSNTGLQVMGALEVAGQTYDRLWLTGLNDQDWPGHMRPYPFVPAFLQKLAGVPEADPENFYTRAQNILGRIFAASKIVTVSFSGGTDDLSASRLLGATKTIIARPLKKVDQATLKVVSDVSGPTLGGVSGGYKIFANQSQCPFRAYVTHHLGATKIEDQSFGLDPRERGTLVHSVLERFWGVGDRQQDLVDEVVVGIKLKQAVSEVLAEKNYSVGDLRGVQLELERERLIALIQSWLKIEKHREPSFTVSATENKFNGSIFGIELNLSFDRIDDLKGGGRLVLDYKTKTPKLKDLFSDRPEEPQLLLYQVAIAQQGSDSKNIGIGYGAINSSKTKLVAVLPQGEDVSVVGGRKPPEYNNWNLLVSKWKRTIELLADEFNAGYAAITPSKNACRYCELKAVCRIQQSLPAGEA